MSDLYDVVAVNIETDARRIIASGKTERDADAIIMMAVARRGVEEEYFTTQVHEPARDQ